VVERDGRVTLSCDASGVIPLYYAATDRGIAFSSLLRPLARAVAAPPDAVGVAELVRFAYTTAGRTVFRDVNRLLPGQVLTWCPMRGVTIEETARTWVGEIDTLSRPDEAAEHVAPVLRDAVIENAPADGRYVLMMSAGWDSRTLLATAVATLGGDRLHAFSHGDLASRELRLAAAVAAAAGVPWSAREIGPDVWNLEHLARTFACTETLVFPHWSWAARANDDAACLASGVMGEVLGGHYGPTQVARGRGKGWALLRSLRRDGAMADVESVERALRLNGLGRMWYLRHDAEGDDHERAALLEAMNQGVAADLARLQARGVASPDQLVEAYVTEHRGVQYITAQALAARLHAGAGLPFADAELLVLASRIPPRLKVHNRVNRSLCLRTATHLQRQPMAATLVPASWPLGLQEGSRLVRRAYEEAHRWVHKYSGGRVGPPRLGWVNFDFLRQGDVVEHVIESLEADLWDRPGMHALFQRLCHDRTGRSMHPFFDQMGKILTVDRMLS
jgi:asparagine synthetase B (glutamine-hydrolysing)